MKPAELLAKRFGELIIKAAAEPHYDSKVLFNADEMGGSPAYEGKQWMHLLGPTTGSAAHREEIRKKLRKDPYEKLPDGEYRMVL